MGTREGTAPRTHFKHGTTTEKLARDLDMAAALDLEVVVCEPVGGRDWVIITRPGPILGPAGRRILHQREE